MSEREKLQLEVHQQPGVGKKMGGGGSVDLVPQR